MPAPKFPKEMQGQTFSMEVAHVSPPRIVTEEDEPPLVDKPFKIVCDVLGFLENEEVEFCIHEPFALHEAPVDTLKAKTSKEDRGVEVEWTLDWKAKKEDLSSSRLVVTARAQSMVNISEPFDVMQVFEAPVTDSEGKPVKQAEVLLRAAGRADITAETDDEGKVAIYVPPGDYIVELLDDDG